MAYTTITGLSNSRAAADLSDFALEPPARQDRLLRSAERAVAAIAPPPDPADDLYLEAAHDGELAAVEYMLATGGGIVKSESLSGVASTTYNASDEALRSVVRAAMGGYAAAADGAILGGIGAAVHNLCEEPLW